VDGVILIICFILLLIVPTAICKLSYWTWFFVAVGVILVIFEIVATIITGKTLTKQFHKYLEENKKRAIVLAVCWMIFFIYLIVFHLLLGY